VGYEGILASTLAVACIVGESQQGATPQSITDAVGKEWIATNGKLKAMFLQAANHHPEDWVLRGETVFQTVQLHGCSVGKDGLWRVRADFEVTGPSGELYVPASSKEVTKDAGEKGETAVYVGLSVPVGPDAPIGKYIVRARVQDLVAGTTVIVRQFYEVVPTVPH